jgi:glycosyltransferase involved in cell wall biosynthesis
VSKRLRISIAMAVYNGERFIREQLDSYLAQTRLPDELVVSDNASTDRTREIVEEFAKSAPFEVKLNLNPTNLGIAKNFERAISLCSGDIIFLSDCDDVWLPHKIERIETVFLAEPSVGVVLSNSKLVDQSLRPLGENVHKRRRAPAGSYRVVARGKEAGRLTAFALGHAMAVRAGLVEKSVPLLDESSSNLAGGWDFIVFIAAASFARVAVVSDPLTLWRRHGRNNSPPLPTPWFRAKKILEPWQMPFLSRVAASMESAARAASMLGPRSRNAVEGSLEAVSYYRMRCKIQESPRYRRIIPIARALLRGDYHYFGSGTLSAIKDLAVRQPTAHRFPVKPSSDVAG